MLGQPRCPPREAPSQPFLFNFFFFFVAWPRTLPLLITEDDTESRMERLKKEKKRQMRSQEEDTLQFWALFSLSGSVSLLPAGVIALPTRRGAGI